MRPVLHGKFPRSNCYHPYPKSDPSNCDCPLHLLPGSPGKTVFNIRLTRTFPSLLGGTPRNPSVRAKRTVELDLPDNDPLPGSGTRPVYPDGWGRQDPGASHEIDTSPACVVDPTGSPCFSRGPDHRGRLERTFETRLKRAESPKH